MFSGWEDSELLDGDVDCGEIFLEIGTIEKLGCDKNWENKCRRLGISPVGVSVGQGGRTRVEFSCIHDSLWESLPEFVSVTTNACVLSRCVGNYHCVRPIAAVEVAPGSWVPVGQDCVDGVCGCVYVLEGVVTQLMPCRFAAKVIAFGDKVTEDDMTVLTGVCRGFRIVDHGCNASYYCDNYASLLGGKFKGDMSERIVQELVDGKVREVRTVPRCVHAMGGIEKSDKSLRPITDCSMPDKASINNYMDSCMKKFHYKSVDDVVDMISKDWACAVTDIKSAYRSVCIIPSHRKFQGFTWDLGNGLRCYEDLRICFGLACGPYLFTLISDFVVKEGSRGGFPHCVNYLDDFLVAGSTVGECQVAQDNLCDALRGLGFAVADKKQIHPSTSVTYLGIIIDTDKMTLSVGEEKMERVFKEIRELQGVTRCKRKKLEQLAGLLAHCATVVRGGRTYTRRIYDLLRDTDGQGTVTLTELVMLDLKWWLTFMNWFNGKARILNSDRPEWNVASDASSKVGFGAYCEFGYTWGLWSGEGDRCEHEYHAPKEDYDDHINEKELWPVLVSLVKWGELWRDSVVHVTTDNTQVLAVLRTGKSSNATAMAWARELFWSSCFYNIDLRCRWIPGVDNIVADALSRLNNPDCREICAACLPGFDVCCYRIAESDGRLGGAEGAVLGA